MPCSSLGDVEGIELDMSAGEIVDFVREGHERQ